MLIRRHRRTDIPLIARLYHDTVRHVNARDDSARQIAAWSPRVYADSFRQKRFRHYTVYVAEEDGHVLGFAELGSDGHIDCFYVHHRRQGQGIGRQLMKRIQATARRRHVPRLFADVSITARPFFLRLGFTVTRRQQKLYRNCRFTQFLMEKRL